MVFLNYALTHQELSNHIQMILFNQRAGNVFYCYIKLEYLVIVLLHDSFFASTFFYQFNPRASVTRYQLFQPKRMTRKIVHFLLPLPLRVGSPLKATNIELALPKLLISLEDFKRVTIKHTKSKSGTHYDASLTKLI